MEKTNPQSSDYGNVVTAIQMLGDIRASESVSVLLDFINLPLVGEEPSRRLKRTSEKYPALKSLIQIGTPAVQAVLDRLADEKPVEKLLLNKIAVIVMTIYRDAEDFHNQSAAISILRHQRKYSTSEHYERRISAIIDILQGKKVEDGTY